MDRNTILAKTAKGQDEVKSRTHGLAQKQRTILIMVDGVATVGDILAKFGGIPEIAASLDALARDGFVELRDVAGAATAPAAPAARSTPLGAPAAAPPQTRKEALSGLARYLIDNLGPGADDLTGRLERARTGAEFAAAVERCAEMLAGVRGAQKAQIFRERATAFAKQFFAGG
jgi:hypothetical protein